MIPTFGVKKLDDDHREMMFLLAQIRNDKDNLPKIVSGFLDYASKHFEDEEKHLRDLRYPGLMAHCEDHWHLQDSFIKRIVSQVANFNADEIETFRKEFERHILTYDAAAAKWIESNKT